MGDKVDRFTLRRLIPWFEIEILFPLWMTGAILAAFVAELTVISKGIIEVYQLPAVGIAVGVVIASVQALGAALASYNWTHNASRKLVYSRRKGQEGQIDKARSQPAFDPWRPMLISVLAGVLAAFVALALYTEIRDGQLVYLDYAIALGSPVGSIAAAVLNGLFVSNETADAEWHDRTAPKPGPAQDRPKPVSRPTKHRTKKEQIETLLQQNPGWDAPRIVQETGFDARYVRKVVEAWRKTLKPQSQAL